MSQPLAKTPPAYNSSVLCPCDPIPLLVVLFSIAGTGHKIVQPGYCTQCRAWLGTGSKRDERADFRATSEQSARRVSNSTIDCLRSCSPSCFFHQRLVNCHAFRTNTRICGPMKSVVCDSC